ncbi:HD-like signal output (HDOD) protein [Tamilnaduibacter salinus]|uniref:HD-like signal output (HDOD) protein n=1 Tax=Tamilnaduibacter salinus TaxID=1484056 RepID=A0A2A2I1F6_9GAMM|nr:HDOD domain-containing protein [Tamilnaduibacter salinus]PAV25861.1 histidine kinase [Tamilnaduibacter salinus]PVY70361.1 HD-like signal output (HDOD) protein [Tamilnaduibacter salinus]
MPPELSNDQIQTILQGIRIPPQPQILVDLQMEQAMPSSDTDQIAQLIRQDVSLSGMMLKFVNSPFYGLRNKITSIEQALDLLGPSTVVNIVNGLSIKGEMSDDAIVRLTNFWDTATDIAMVSATIAKHIGARNPDESYALGLFHNAGIPLMLDRFRDYENVMIEAYGSPTERIIDMENRYFNTNHAVVGYYTAKSWNLPRPICDAIAEHHTVVPLFANRDATHGDKKTLLATLKIAEHLCGNYRVLGQQEEDYEWQQIETDVLEYVGLTSFDLSTMAENFRDMGIDAYWD